jgi:hypothetical protein
VEDGVIQAITERGDARNSAETIFMVLSMKYVDGRKTETDRGWYLGDGIACFLFNTEVM